MSRYRRYFVPGGTYFLTIVTHRRLPLFADPENIQRLRRAARIVKQQLPFDIVASVVLPDHVHFIWSLPPDDSAYSKRIGRLKVEFTRSVGEADGALSASRRKHRESGNWQRRFSEHTLSEDDFDQYFDYVHYNPVKHGYVSCPHVLGGVEFLDVG